MICRGKNRQYELKQKPLAVGGEGEIYEVIGSPSLVAKIYKPNKASSEKERKLVRMQIAWPQDVLYANGKFVGFVMPKMAINEDLNVIYEYGSAAKYPHMHWDIQDGSKTYRCDVGMPDYLPVEVQKKMRGGITLSTAQLPTFSQETDNFALAIHIFQLLMNGTHPFSCAKIPKLQHSVVRPGITDNILNGLFPFIQSIPNMRIPVFSPPLDILPNELQALFKRAFIDGHNNPTMRPTPENWYKELKNLRGNLNTNSCQKNGNHQCFSKLTGCPWCIADHNFLNPSNPKSFQQIIPHTQSPPSKLQQTPISPRTHTPPPSPPANPHGITPPPAPQSLQPHSAFVGYVGNPPKTSQLSSFFTTVKTLPYKKFLKIFAVIVAAIIVAIPVVMFIDNTGLFKSNEESEVTLSSPPVTFRPSEPSSPPPPTIPDFDTTPYFFDSLLGTSELHNNWNKDGGATWKFDGDSGFGLTGTGGYLILSDLPSDANQGYTIVFEARGQRNQDATLAWVYLSVNENGILVDGLSFCNGRGGKGDISYHPISNNAENRTEISELPSTRTDRFVNIKLNIANGAVRVYVNGEYYCTQELTGVRPAFAFYRGTQDYHIRNFYIMLNE
jgi:hypothetical protein